MHWCQSPLTVLECNGDWSPLTKTVFVNGDWSPLTKTECMAPSPLTKTECNGDWSPLTKTVLVNGDWCHAFGFNRMLTGVMHSVLVNGDWCHEFMAPVTMVTGVIYAWHQSPWWLKQNVMAFCHHCQWWLNAMAFCHHCLKRNALVPVHSVFVNGDWMPWHSVTIV